MKFNSRGSTGLSNVVLFVSSILVMLLLVMLSGRVSSAADDPDATATSIALTIIALTPNTLTPIPTSDVPANFIVVDNANSNFTSSLALNPEGIPVIAYTKRLTVGLALARCNNALTCNAPQITTIDTDARSVVKMVLDGDIPVFAFIDADKYLKLGRCQNAACSSVTLKTLETTQTIITYDIVLDQNQLPVIIYKQSIPCGSGCTNGPLKLVRCNNVVCDTPSITQIDAYTFINALSIAIDHDNNPIVSYSRDSQGFRMAICYDETCSNKYIVPISSNGGGSYSSIHIDSSNIPVVAYRGIGGIGLRLAYCNDNTTCDTPTNSLLDSPNNGYYVSLALDDGNLPVMSHHNASDADLKLTRCVNPTCTSVENVVLDSDGSVGIGTSLALYNGKPYISHINSTTGKLMLYIENKPPPPTITPTPSLTPSPTLTPSLTPSPTLTPSLTPSVTPTLITPTSPPNSTPAAAFFTIRHPTLTWNAVSWAQGYQIEIDDDPAFGSPLIAEVDANIQEYMVESELADGMYYWHVRAGQNAADWGNWSATETIVISAP